MPQRARALRGDAMALLKVEDALARVLRDVPLTGIERVALLDARDRILAAPLAAGHDKPPFDASAMDGYAVRAADVAGLPARLRVIGTSAAGRGFAGTVGAGEAVRIFTGAPVPAGADAIVIQENSEAAGDSVVVKAGAVEPGHVRRRAFDFRRGERLLAPGTRLAPRTLTLAAAMGHGEVPVRARPRVAIIATGDELVLPGSPVGADQIVCSNPFGIAAMVAAAGGAPRFLGIAGDTRAALATKLDAAASAEIVVTIGGASVGDYDLVAPVLEGRGIALDFWKIAMRPGMPLIFAASSHQRILGLPGNPVSALICARIFLLPLVRAMLGDAAAGMASEPAIADIALEANGPRQHYARAELVAGSGGHPRVRPIRSQDSTLLAPLAAADCLIVRPPDAPAVPAGGATTILRLDF